MIQNEDFEQRLKELDWTLYKLAKEFAEHRAADGDVSPASRYHSSISKAIENPGKSKLETIEDIVQVLNGELTILWEPGRVVTIRLEDETIEALKQRAENDGKTINDIAKQLLLQALSGLPAQHSKKLTNLVIAEQAKIYRSFHPVISSAYSAVHQWLSNIPDAKGYQQLDYSKDILHSLDKADLKSKAFQFYTLFPPNYFKAVHILDNVIDSSRLMTKLRYHPRIYLLDIGGTMGAATTALIAKILTLPQEEIRLNPIEIICIGIEPNIYSYAIYQKLMQQLKEKIAPFNILLNFQPINESLAQATLTTITYLKNKCKGDKSSDKLLSNLFVMQLDIAASIDKDNILKRERDKQLQALGLELQNDTEIKKDFWQDEALALKRLLEEVPVETLYLMTIGTKNLEHTLKQIIQITDINQGTKAISNALETFIGKNHTFSDVIPVKDIVYFENPVNSYWQEKGIFNHETQFHALCQTIKNREIEEDNQWNQLISLENIELAWVKARNNVFNESFYDEIEIRLFESNLDENLQMVVDNLVDSLYSDKFLPSNQDIDYKFVKSRTKGRSKQLTRLEEEILAIAILQTLAQKNELNFYSYKLKSEQTEDLYEDYFPKYKNFLEESRASAESYPNGAVMRTDIESYYVKVIQQQLLDISVTELEISSNRIKWLLSQILKRNLNNGHENGMGLKQGTLTSGFYANLYLKAVDDYFRNQPRWKHQIKLHRYVDDIIAVVPRTHELEPFEIELKEQLGKLGLNLNENKTEYYDNISDFLPTTKLDTDLDPLNKEFNFELLDPLWIMNYDYRTEFELANRSHDDKSWWKLIKIYQHCLYSQGIYITEMRLSRKIYQKLVTKKLNNQNDLTFPSLPRNDKFIIIANWSSQFQQKNDNWVNKKNQLKSKFVHIFQDSLKELQEITVTIKEKADSPTKTEKRELNIKQRKLQSRIRLSVNKLLILGFDPVCQEIVNLICDPDLFVIRDLLDVVIGLASQGHINAINQLWEHFQKSNITNEETSTYYRAILLEAFRFLPIIEFNNWELIFNCATQAQSDIEKLKATETWLYLGQLAKPYVQNQHFQNVAKALESNPPPFTRLKKNYILILGLYNYDLPDNISFSEEEVKDYLIKDAVKLAESGKVAEIFQEVEPARVRQYYNPKKTEVTKEQKFSL
ncbi:RNA-directed DNA polymerase [Anabaena sp. CS-542/02]|uniref:RNA-directed DNA polymerase n=1 Tax=Anabaena sp. CS-542/02 TaxID=3021719 RepID=UPI00232BFAC0|nr:RNA-directed DNA polymerase [Anabaena sp. CS-542/02]MDB9447400.1 RNA-directed DNA polymerase [Anabaena sp. CS-542/02]